MFCSEVYVPLGVQEHVARYGNERIVRELYSRGEDVVPVLEAHLGDGRSVYTGGNGHPETVGTACSRVLRWIAEKPN